MRRKILLIDDSDSLRKQVKELLLTNEFDIIEAEHGQAALDQLANCDSLDLILCDVNMPVMDGITFLKRYQEDTNLPRATIFMLTTESNREMKDQCKTLGVRAWVTKPYNPDKLLFAINKVLEAA